MTQQHSKECECGCGLSVIPPTKFKQGHWAKNNRDKLSIARLKDGRSDHGDGYFTVHYKGKHHLEHRVIAEKALGRPLPKNAEIHHINENKGDNYTPYNLIICPTRAYHRLLHVRQDALEACGNANWRKCYYCGKYDDPANLYIPPIRGSIIHPACGRARAKIARTGKTL